MGVIAQMSNSPYVYYTRLSPNNSGKRTHKIDRITPHCTAGLISLENLGSMFAKTNTPNRTSSNYAISADGRVGMYVNENCRSWCSSSRDNDQRAVTIECASVAYAPYTMTSEVWNTLIDLCEDICKRNGKTRLLWLGDKNKTLNYKPAENEMVLTVHRWFANKDCPGDWLYSRLDDLAEIVTYKLGGNKMETAKMYKVQIGAFRSKENAEKFLQFVKDAGFKDAFIVNTK